MISFQHAFRDEFLEKSIQIEKIKKDKIKNTKEFILWAETKIEELHQWLKSHDFENNQDEIEFFKEIKPGIISKLIFEKEVLRIETSAPSGKIQIRKFYETELRKIYGYSQNNNKFYQYYRSGSEEFDELYFTRTSKKNRLETECIQINFDPTLSTFFDYKLAKIIAFDELVKYLESQISALKSKSRHQENHYKSKLHWSGTKVDLVELIYALHCQKVINHGNIEIKEIASELSRMLNIDINDNLYRTFTDIKNRKNPNSKFIQSLADNFQKMLIEENSL
jgi:hypothetical protein